MHGRNGGWQGTAALRAKERANGRGGRRGGSPTLRRRRDAMRRALPVVARLGQARPGALVRPVWPAPRGATRRHVGTPHGAAPRHPDAEGWGWRGGGETEPHRAALGCPRVHKAKRDSPFVPFQPAQTLLARGCEGERGATERHRHGARAGGGGLGGGVRSALPKVIAAGRVGAGPRRHAASPRAAAGREDVRVWWSGRRPSLRGGRLQTERRPDRAGVAHPGQCTA